MEVLKGKRKLAKKIKNPEFYSDKVHESFNVISELSGYVLDLFEKYENFSDDFELDFYIFTDQDSNTLEIFINSDLPYPYEPSIKMRMELFKLGFSNLSFIFENAEIGQREIVQNYKPRRWENLEAPIETKYGSVDDRFNEKAWLKKYSNIGLIK